MAEQLRADGREFSLRHNACGLSEWVYNSPHPLLDLMAPGYFEGVRTHGLRRGDKITCVHKPALGQGWLEWGELMVVSGVDERENGASAPIRVVALHGWNEASAYAGEAEAA